MRTNSIKQPEFVAIDSSHLGNVIRELQSEDAGARYDAKTFQDAITSGSYILVLSFHHLQELIGHNGDNVVQERIAFIRSLPLVGLVASYYNEILSGSIIDIQTTEVAIAFQQPDASPTMIRDTVFGRIFRLVSGEEAVRPFTENLSAIRVELASLAKKSREIVAISRSRFSGVEHLKVRDLLNGRPHSPLQAQRNFAFLAAALRDDIRQHGDRRISNHDAVSSEFIEDILQQNWDILYTDNPSLQIIARCDIDISEISPETTIGELGEWASFRAKLKAINKNLRLHWPELKDRVKESRLPSGIINLALARFRPHSAESKGSDLIDNYLACLSPYADITFVDKRTYEGLQQAQKKDRKMSGFLRRIEKARNTSSILRCLS